MIRTQIQLTERQARELKRQAAERGVSVATLIREGVDRLIAEADSSRRRKRAVDVVERSRFRSGLPDVAENHDRYLAEDFAR